jgi:hypothetical protein
LYKFTYILERHAASIFRVVQGRTSTLKTVAVCSSEILANFYQATEYIPGVSETVITSSSTYSEAKHKSIQFY